MELPKPRPKSDMVLAPRKVDDFVDPEVMDKQDYALDVLRKMRDMIKANREDFQQFYSPSDDIYGETRSGNDDRPSFSDLEMLANERCGFGWYLTKGISGDVVRNGFEFVNFEGKVEHRPQIYKWAIKADLYNQLETLLRYERTYGTAFLVSYWSKNDQFDKPPPKKPPVKFQAFPPSVLYPINIADSGLLDYDEEVWEFQGGRVQSVSIHRDRVYPLATRPLPYSWLGLSIFEPIYLSASSYLNLVINGTKMLAKYGNVIPVFTMSDENPSYEMYQEYEDLINEFKAAYTFILGKGEEINFEQSKIGQGIQEFAEFLKEDISSGTGIPLNQLFGRAVSGGIGGAGALTSERGKIQTISNIQHNISDDVWKIVSRCGWNVEGLLVRFRLDLQKTEMAKLEERNLELQNYILEEQLKQLQLQTIFQAQQMQMQMENPDIMQLGMEGGADGSGNQLPYKTATQNPADKTKHAMGGGRGGPTAGQEKASLTGMIRRNQDFLSKNINTYKMIRNQFKKERKDN